MKIPFLKTLAVLLAGGFLFTAAVQADSQRRDREWHQGPPTAEQQLYRMSEALDLDSDQSVALFAVLQAAHDERQALHEEVMAAFGPEMCSLRQDTEAAILAILTEEQAETFLALKDERQERKQTRRGGEGPECPDS